MVLCFDRQYTGQTGPYTRHGEAIASGGKLARAFTSALAHLLRCPHLLTCSVGLKRKKMNDGREEKTNIYIVISECTF